MDMILLCVLTCASYVLAVNETLNIAHSCLIVACIDIRSKYMVLLAATEVWNVSHLKLAVLTYFDCFDRFDR